MLFNRRTSHSSRSLLLPEAGGAQLAPHELPDRLKNYHQKCRPQCNTELGMQPGEHSKQEALQD